MNYPPYIGDIWSAIIISVFIGVPSIMVAIWTWGITEPPQRKGWEATKAFIGMAFIPLTIFGAIIHAGIWLLMFASPFLFAYDKLDRNFGGKGVKWP